jgi:hypothetical protein
MKKIITPITAVAVILLLNACIVSCKKSSSPSQKTITLRNGANDVRDSHLDYKADAPGNANSPGGSMDQLPVYSWTVNGATVTGRTLLGFSLEAVPKGAEILSAKLSMFGMPQSYTLHAQATIPGGNAGANNLLIQRVTSPWTESTVTWNTQPTSTTDGQLELPASNLVWEYNVTDIDVTSMIKTMQAGDNNGFMIKLKTETPYAGITYMSREYADTTKRPTLTITYKY